MTTAARREPSSTVMWKQRTLWVCLVTWFVFSMAFAS